MDINSLYTADSHDQGAEIRLKNQFGKDMDCYITIVGPDSKKAREIQKSNMRDLLLAIKGEDTDDPENKEEIDLARRTLGWRGFTDGNKELEFSTEAAVVLYTKAPYIVNQLTRAFNDRANFMEDSAKK